METCRMCGARLADEIELERHDKTMHPNMAGKKGGERPPDTGALPMPPPDRPTD